MTEILSTVYLITLFFAPPALMALWFFGLRRYIRKKGKTVITSTNWGLSMWADWTVAWEIGREERNVPFSVKAFLILHIIVLIEIITAFTI